MGNDFEQSLSDQTGDVTVVGTLKVLFFINHILLFDCETFLHYISANSALICRNSMDGRRWKTVCTVSLKMLQVADLLKIVILLLLTM